MKFTFEKCAKLALEDPDAFEVYRAELVKQFIEQKSPEEQKRLKGLQFQIDMERRKARTPMASCIKLNGMMMDHFYDEYMDASNKKLSSYEKKECAVIYAWPENKKQGAQK